MRRTPFAAVLLTLAAAVAVAPAESRGGESELPDFAETVEGWTEQPGFFPLYVDEDEPASLRAAIPKDRLGEPFFLATSVAGGSDYAGWQWDDELVRFERLDDELLLVALNTRQRAEEGRPLAEVVRRTYADRLLATLDILSIGPDGEVLIDLGDLLVRRSSIFFGGFSLDSSVARLARTKGFPQNVEVGVKMPLRGDGTFMTLHYSISALPELTDYEPRRADDRIGYFLTAIRDYSQGDPEEGRMVRYVNRWKLEKADPSLEVSPPKEPIVFYVEKTVPYRYRGAVQEGIRAWNDAFRKVGIEGAIEVRQQTDTQFADLDPEDVRYNFFRWITSETPFAMGPSRVDPRNGRILDADIVFDDSMLRGYMTDYEVMIREEPSKLLPRPMREHLEANPQRHPMAALREASGGDSPARAYLRDLLRDVGPAAGAPAEDEGPIAERADLARLRGERGPRGADCMIGRGRPHQLAFSRLALRELGTLPEGFDFQGFLEQVVRETVMHEVGHTLGLRHNFKASRHFSLEEINSEERPAVLTASVMDYMPVNIAAGEDRTQGNFLSTDIGPYDRLAIEYGYSLHDEGSEELAAIPERMAKEGLPYATDEDTGSPDPWITRWDLGSDPVAFADNRAALVERLWKDLEDRAVEEGESYSKLRRAFDMTLYEIGNAGVFVSRMVGGLDFHRDHRGDPGARQPIRVVEPARQREALEWVCANIFAEDSFDVSPELLRRLAASRWRHWGSSDTTARLDYPLLDRIRTVQTWALTFVTGDTLLARLWENEQLAGEDEDVLTIPELFDSLEEAIFAELDGGGGDGATARDPVVTSIRQNLQDAYVRRLIQIALGNGISPPVANKLAWSRLKGLEERFAGVLERNLDPYTRAHLESLEAKSRQARTAEYVHVASGGCGLARPEGAAPFAGLAVLALLGGLGVALRRRGSPRCS